VKETSGFSITELMIVCAIIAILTIVAIPNAPMIRTPAYNESADSMSVQFQIAQNIYKSANGNYATSLAELLTFEKNLTDTPELTFAWVGTPNRSGYTFQVRHRRGNHWYTCTPLGKCL
jgi:prepilin-type N-terminal cleavage/methylation domain-containing protein